MKTCNTKRIIIYVCLSENYFIANLSGQLLSTLIYQQNQRQMLDWQVVHPIKQAESKFATTTRGCLYVRMITLMSLMLVLYVRQLDTPRGKTNRRSICHTVNAGWMSARYIYTYTIITKLWPPKVKHYVIRMRLNDVNKSGIFMDFTLNET